MTLDVEGLGFSYGRREVLRDISLSTGEGITSLIGPNGAGKSTLVKCLAGIHRPGSGTAFFNGLELISGKRDPDLRVAYMPQDQPCTTKMTVLEVILLGRVRSLSIKVSEDDMEHCYGALEDLNIEELAERPFNQLSGGQCQMVMVAQCLASDPDMIILDEPINNLDLRRQLEMFETMNRMTKKNGLTTLMVLHDINLAARYSDRLAVMGNGRMHGYGTPSETITEEMLEDVYGVKAIVDRGRFGIPRIEPICSCSCRRGCHP
ncbi:MAG: ABC transporter ATP-binding protein [Gudongella sp.]|nr:ABC transporter ATP-binding protein [Gudongella sp.]